MKESINETKRMQLIAGLITESEYKRVLIKEALPGGKIRVFSRKEMKDYKKDVKPSEIKFRGKDIKVMATQGFYLVNRVELKDGTKGYVWSKNQKLD